MYSELDLSVGAHQQLFLFSPEAPVSENTSSVTAPLPNALQLSSVRPDRLSQLPDQTALDPNSIVTADEVRGVAGVAAWLMSDTHYDATGKMVDDGIGASVSTIGSIASGAYALGEDHADPYLVRNVAQNCYQHIAQLEDAVKIGGLSAEQVAMVVGLGRPAAEMRPDERERLAPILRDDAPSNKSMLNNGIVGNGKVLGSKGFADRLAHLGFSEDEINDHAVTFAGRRVMYAFDDSLAARAAAYAQRANLSKRETMWASIPTDTGLPLGKSALVAQVGSDMAGTLVVSRVPQADLDQFPFDPATYAGVQPGAQKGSQSLTFTESSWLTMRQDLKDVMDNVSIAPLWAHNLAQITAPELPNAAYAAAGKGMVFEHDPDTASLKLMTAPPWTHPEMDEVVQVIRQVDGREFVKQYGSPSYWKIPETSAPQFAKRLTMSDSSQCQAAADLLSDDRLGVDLSASAVNGQLSVREHATGAVASLGGVAAHRSGDDVLIQSPPPWTAGWETVKDTLKYHGRAKFNGATKQWVIPAQKAGRCAEAIEEKARAAGHTELITNDTPTPLALAACLRDAAISKRQATPAEQAHDSALTRLNTLVTANTPSPETERALTGLFPEGLSLRNHQKVFVDFMKATHNKALLGDDMGMGKTVSVAAYLASRPESRPALVVSPANVRSKWAKEINKWGAQQTMTAGELVGRDGEIPDTDVTVVTYGVLKNHEEALKKHGFKTLVMDECHYVKGADTQRTKALTSIWEGMKSADPDAGIIGLSGTPVPNRAKELGGPMQLINPDIFPDLKTYYKDHCITGYESTGYGAKAIWGLNNGPDLHRTLREGRPSMEADSERPACMPLMLRRTKAEYGDLPDITHRQVAVNISTDERHELARNNAALATALYEAHTHQDVLAALNAERQAVGLMKAPYIADRAADIAASSNSVVVFLHHRSVVDLVRTRLEDQGYDPLIIQGSTPANKRLAIAESFQDGSNPIILCTQAAREGIDLTAAHHLIHGEWQWNPMAMNQGTDRIHRFGQTEDCFVEYLNMPGSTDDHLGPMVQKKSDEINAMIDGIDPEEEAPSDLIMAVRNSILTQYGK